MNQPKTQVALEQEQHNRRVQIAGSLFSKLADALANTKIVLPALFHAIAAPTFFVGLISPIRESFSMLPQIFLSGFVSRQLKPQHVYALGAIAQALSLAAMLMAFLNLEGWTGGLGILSALLLFSLARSLCSLSSKTVLGATIRKSRRGGLMGVAGTIAGGISILYGSFLYFYASGSSSQTTSLDATTSSSVALSQTLAGQQWVLGSLLASASACFLLAALSYRAVQWKHSSTDRGNETSTQDSTQTSYHSPWRLLQGDQHFRRFVVTRAFMMVSALALPYIAMITLKSSQSGETSAISLFAILVIIEGSSGLLSSRLWGAVADSNSRMVLLITAILSSVFCATSALLLNPEIEQKISTPAWAWLLIYASMSLIHNGVRLGRKTYIVDLADDQEQSHRKRTEYVAVSNTCIGILLLFFGLLSALLAQSSLFLLFLLFSVSAGIASLLSINLKKL